MVFLLCLCHVVTDDKMKEKFLQRDNMMNRLQLDGRNSSSRSLTFWEEVAGMMSNNDIIYSSNQITSWHPLFCQVHPLTVGACVLKGVQFPVDASTVQDCF